MTFETLVQQPESLRDERWEAQFLVALVPRAVVLESDEAKTGPDGWPYFHVRATAEGGSEPLVRLVKGLAGRGIGLVVNAHKMVPDYIFTYGMIWNFVETGRFIVPQEAKAQAGKVETDLKQMLSGAPTEKYLPLYVRSVLREFLKAQGFKEPRVLVVSTPDFKHIDLVISLESLNNAPLKEHKTLAEVISWFLPLHYNLVLASEQGMPAFHPL
jgi:hypothetical protein